MEVDLLIADKTFGADKRVITVLANKNKVVVIPPAPFGLIDHSP
jgi:MinD superfamily P-loop ATPase